MLFKARYRGLGPTHKLAEYRSGTLEYFLTERIACFAGSGRQTVAPNMHHVGWPLEDAEAEIEHNDLATAIGIELPAQAPVLHYSRRLAVYIWPAVKRRRTGGGEGFAFCVKTVVSR